MLAGSSFVSWYSSQRALSFAELFHRYFLKRDGAAYQPAIFISSLPLPRLKSFRELISNLDLLNLEYTLLVFNHGPYQIVSYHQSC